MTRMMPMNAGDQRAHKAQPDLGGGERAEQDQDKSEEDGESGHRGVFWLLSHLRG